MSTISSPAVAESRSTGRGLFWAGLGLCVLGIALNFLQMGLKQLSFTPWYLPALTALGAVLLLVSAMQRRTWPRMIFFVLTVALAGFECYLLAVLLRLPAYQGPVAVGDKFPPFQATRADGRPFTDKDLQHAGPTVLTFFRGRW